MEVTVHSVYDQIAHADYVMGLDDYGYERAMDFLQKDTDNKYEYCGTDESINIRWDMTEEQCRSYVKNGIEPGKEYDSIHDYCGAMFFGNFKLEFITTADGNYHNLFLYGKEGYAELEDGTPYDEMSDDFVDHSRRTLEGFAKTIEAQIVPWLNRHTDFIDDALEKTNPVKWYPGTKRNYMQETTRRA